MKIRKSSRITALFLALVMILPLISIPTFAEEVTSTNEPVWSQNFDSVANLGDVLSQYPKSAKIEDGTLVIDRKATWSSELAVLYTDRSGAKDVTAVEYADGREWTGIENYDGSAVKVTTSEGSGITGVITTVANATNNVNSCTVVTDKGTYAGAKTLAIVEGPVANAICGNCANIASTVAREAYLKNSKITPTDEKVIVLSADYYFGANFATGQIEGRIYGYGYTNAAHTTGKSAAIDLFIAKASGDKVQIVKHGDNTDIYNGSTGVLVNKSAWVNVRFVIDVSRNFPMTFCYVNDELAFITSEDRSNNDWSALHGLAYIEANKWNLGHTSRGVQAQTLNTSTNNSFAVDNCAIYTSTEGFDTRVYKEDFENLTVSDGKVVAGNNFAAVEGILTVETTEENKWIKSEYGIIDNSNRDKNNMLKVPKLSYKYFDWVKLEAKYFIQLGKYAKGEIVTQFRYASSSAGTDKAWFNLYTIYVGTGNISAGGNSKAGALADGWNTVTMYLNLKTGQEVFAVNGDLAFYSSAGVTNIELYKSSEAYGRWTALKLDRSAMTYTEEVDYGYVGLDDASITCVNGDLELGSLYNQTFEKDTVGSAPAAFDASQSSALADPGKVVQDGSNKYWEIPLTATNNNKHSYIRNPAITHASTIVYEANTYISTDAAGSIEARFAAATGTFVNADGTTIENRGVSWLTMYRLTYTASNNTVTVTPGGPQNTDGIIVAKNTFNKGDLVKITVVIDAVSGVYDIYLNNTLIITNVYFTPQYHNGTGWVVGVGLKDVKLQANKLLYTPTSSATEGSIRLDNIAFYDTTDGLNLVGGTPTAFAGYSEDFSTNTPNVTNKTAGQAVASTATSAVVDGVYSVPTTDAANVNVNVTANHSMITTKNASKIVTEAKYQIPADGVVKFQSQFFNVVALSTTNGTTSPHKSLSWIDLFTVNATDVTKAPTISLSGGTKTYHTNLTRGEWFTISTVIDLKTGATEMYVDGALYASGYLNKGGVLSDIGIPADKWIIAKPNTVPDGATYAYAGNLLVDDASISVLDSSKIVDESGKGLVSAKVNGKLVKDSTKFYGTVTEQKYLMASDYANLVATETELGSIRVGADLESSGLRFATKVNTALMEQLKAMLANGEIKALTFGTLVAPAKYIETNGDLDKTNYNVVINNEEEQTGEFVPGKTVLDIQATAYSDWDVDKNAATTHFVGSIIQIFEENYGREFAARGYVEVTLNSGEVIFIGSATTATNSVKAQAQETINAGTYAGYANILDILNAYVGQ